jgi:hypothetical protein
VVGRDWPRDCPTEPLKPTTAHPAACCCRVELPWAPITAPGRAARQFFSVKTISATRQTYLEEVRPSLDLAGGWVTLARRACGRLGRCPGAVRFFPEERAWLRLQGMSSSNWRRPLWPVLLFTYRALRTADPFRRAPQGRRPPKGDYRSARGAFWGECGCTCPSCPARCSSSACPAAWLTNCFP